MGKVKRLKPVRRCRDCHSNLSYIKDACTRRWVCVESNPVRYIPSAIGDILYTTRGTIVRGEVIKYKRGVKTKWYKAYLPHVYARCEQERKRRGLGCQPHYCTYDVERYALRPRSCETGGTELTLF